MANRDARHSGSASERSEGSDGGEDAWYVTNGEEERRGRVGGGEGERKASDTNGGREHEQQHKRPGKGTRGNEETKTRTYQLDYSLYERIPPPLHPIVALLLP